MRVLLAFVLLFLPSLSFAETRLTAGEFEALTTGRTLFFNQNGTAYGAEQYRKDRSVIWSFLDGQCQRGAWVPGADDTICFTYDSQEGPPICWAFFRDAGRIRARVVGDDPANDLTVAGSGMKPLICKGPDVGA